MLRIMSVRTLKGQHLECRPLSVVFHLLARLLGLEPFHKSLVRFKEIGSSIAFLSARFSVILNSLNIFSDTDLTSIRHLTNGRSILTT